MKLPEVGEMIKLNYNDNFMDKVTMGKEYEVVGVNGAIFKIINDDGQVTFPITGTFSKVEKK